MEGCDGLVAGRGWCRKHWQRWRKHGDPLREPYRVPEVCIIDGCDKSPKRGGGYGWCAMHYQRFKNNGDPTVVRRIVLNLPREEWFWHFIDKNGPVSDYRPDLGPCWLWTGWIDPDSGYGTCLDKRAHVVGYEVAHGPVPGGLVVDHLCRVRHCVRGSHLEAVTNIENIMRGQGASAKAARATQCCRGHEYNDVNTYYRANGHRQCRVCGKEDAQAKRDRQRAATRAQQAIEEFTVV